MNDTIYIKEESKNDKFGKNPDFLGLVERIISHLPGRTQEILKKRYGLAQEKRETLEHIGQDYGITRERVRQIISDAKKNVTGKNQDPDFLAAEEVIIFTIEKNNGIMKEAEIVKKFGKDGAREANAIKFFAGCSGNIKTVFEKEIIENSWVVSETIASDLKKIIAEAQKMLAKTGKTHTDREIAKKIELEFSDFSEEKILSFLATSNKIKKNKFGKWGLKHWAEINPKGTREKIYLVLKEKRKPLHFTDIAKHIDEFKLGKKKAHPQTVHNELIKDDRFVLIGRGIYALSEWGYSEGTIKDVIRTILEKSDRPLPKEEILEEVFRVRKVKKTTVMINLNNSKVFEKHNDSYTLRNTRLDSRK